MFGDIAEETLEANIKSFSEIQVERSVGKHHLGLSKSLLGMLPVNIIQTNVYSNDSDNFCEVKD